MTDFKAMLEADAEVFLNLNEFAEMHEVEGQSIAAVLGGDTSTPNLAAWGIAQADVTLYARPRDLPPRRTPGSRIEIDGKIMIIQSWNEDCGIAAIGLVQNVT